jgi:hypothetical protein
MYDLLSIQTCAEGYAFIYLLTPRQQLEAWTVVCLSAHKFKPGVPFNFRYEFLCVRHVELKLMKQHSVKHSLKSAEQNVATFWDVDIKATIHSCGIFRMALWTPGF